MRNLIEYPVTPQEIADCLRKIAEEKNAEQAIGGMEPLLLKMAADIVLAADEVLKGMDRRFALDRRDWLRYTSPWKEAGALVDSFNAVPK